MMPLTTLVHELGHALAAIICGFNVTEVNISIYSDGYFMSGFTIIEFDETLYLYDKIIRVSGPLLQSLLIPIGYKLYKKTDQLIWYGLFLYNTLVIPINIVFDQYCSYCDLYNIFTL